MLDKFFENLRSEDPILPNKFTIALGERIRAARLEAKMNQAELADRIYVRQSSISKIENGVRSVSSEEILYLCYALDKAINYFFPPEFSQELGENELTILEKELIKLIRRLDTNDLRKLIVQVRALAEFQD